MKVLYFGTYSKGEGYPRNDMLIKGLRLNNVEVIECHYPLWKGVDEKSRKPLGMPQYFILCLRILKAYLSLSFRFISISGYDVIIVGYTGHVDIFIVWLLNIIRNKPIVFDIFISLYDTIIMDRGWFGSSSCIAKALYWVDKKSCEIADLVLLDTEEHIKYFCGKFGLPRQKFLRLYAGADNIFTYSSDAFKDSNSCVNKRFKVVYFGTFIPLHGVDTIIRAAKLIENEDIEFFLIGKGNTLCAAKELAGSLGIGNLTFIDKWLSVTELICFLRGMDISFGIFGTTGKARRVIPFKVFNCMAMGKAVITSDTPASRELLKDGFNALLVTSGDPCSLADAILRMKRNRSMILELGLKARSTFEKECAPYVLGKKLKEEIKKIIYDPAYTEKYGIA